MFNCLCVKIVNWLIVNSLEIKKNIVFVYMFYLF